jgi:tetratricopeptide (TPR) repeat protein
MRAVEALAVLLGRVGREEEAAKWYQWMLKLNPNDNQGVRGSLVAHYINTGDLPAARALLNQYQDDISIEIVWADALCTFLEGGGDAAEEKLRKAEERNPYVRILLESLEDVPRDLVMTHYQVRSPEEAVVCLMYLGEAWRRHPEAMAWLRCRGKATVDMPPKGKRRYH